MSNVANPNQERHSTGDDWQLAFESARKEHAWTLGFQSSDQDDMSAPLIPVEGQLEKTLRWVFYRTGPARHDRGGMRYHHRWDGDGMVHAFRFSDEGLSHHGRYVRTEKYVAEEAAGQFLRGAFGTRISGADAFPNDIY